MIYWKQGNLELPFAVVAWVYTVIANVNAWPGGKIGIIRIVREGTRIMGFNLGLVDVKKLVEYVAETPSIVDLIKAWEHMPSYTVTDPNGKIVNN